MRQIKKKHRESGLIGRDVKPARVGRVRRNHSRWRVRQQWTVVVAGLVAAGLLGLFLLATAAAR